MKPNQISTAQRASRVADLCLGKRIMAAKPRRLALVKFKPRDLPLVGSAKAPRYPFKKDMAYIFLGEIPNMPGHCVVAERKSGKIHAGYHIEAFIELTSDET